MRILFLLVSFSLPSLVLAVSCPRLDVELALLNYGNPRIPENLASTRTAVIICHEQTPFGEPWKELAHEVHGTLAQMAIDPVLYLNAFDYYANDFVNKRFVELLRTRRITNLLVLRVQDVYQLELVLVPYDQFVAKNGRGSGWRATGSGLGGVLYQLGTAVKQADLRNSNFLIATKPEFLEDIVLFQGDKLANYPGAMRRQKVGLALMEEMQVPGTLTESQRAQVEGYNLMVQQTNEDLQQVFEQFEYDWQPIVYTNDEAAMGDRIQYIVFLMHTSGEHIRRMLNYDIDKNETDYLSVTPGPSDDETTLKRLSAQDLAYKVYVTQTRSKDVFVGREWDADDTASRGLRNFVFAWYRQVGTGR